MKAVKKQVKFLNWKFNLEPLILSFAVVFTTALAGSLLTSNAVKSTWYQSIKSSLTPPNWVFPVVWSILFLLIAISLYLALTNAKTKQMKRKVELVFGVNLLLNFLWSFFFFYLRKPVWAFIELFFLWFSILAMILVTRKINKLAFKLLIPYLLWVSFAGVLNYLSAFG